MHTLNTVKLFSIQREHILVHKCMSLNTQNFTFSKSLTAALLRSSLTTITDIVLHSIFPSKPCDVFAVTWKYSLPRSHCSSLNMQFAITRIIQGFRLKLLSEHPSALHLLFVMNAVWDLPAIVTDKLLLMKSELVLKRRGLPQFVYHLISKINQQKHFTMTITD